MEMAPRAKDDAFNIEAPNDMDCADLAEELHTVFGKSRDQVDRLKAQLKEEDYTVVAELKLTPSEKLLQMLHASGLGTGAEKAIAWSELCCAHSNG